MHFDPSVHPGNDLFWAILNVYWSTCSPAVRVMVGGYLVVLAYLCLKGSKKEKHFFVTYTLILVVTCLNPWMCRYLVDHWSFFLRYFRLFWLLPMSMVYSYVAVKFFNKTNVFGKIVLGFVVAGLFIFSCQQVMDKTSFVDIYTGADANTGMIMVDNVYKVEDDIIEVSRIIETDSGDATSLKKALYNRSTFIELRTYDAAILPIINFGEIPDYDYNEALANSDNWGLMCILFNGKTDGVDTDAITSEFVKNTMAGIDCDYVILPKSNAYYDAWKEAFTSVGDTEVYLVLRLR